MKTLVEAAVVGTAHQSDRAVLALAGDLPVDELIASVEAEMPIERRVLLAAALRSTYDRAGRTSLPDVTPLPPAEAESRPVCSALAGALLDELIAIRPRRLLREALVRLDQAGAIVTPSLLPALLDTRDDTLAQLLPRVIGARGRWLAALGDDGDWLIHDAPDAEEARRIWQEGSHPRRLAVLAERRRTAPAEAREWLAESWADDTAEHRTELLESFAVGLSLDDVPFLDAARSDRSLYVRAVAARLLGRLPESEPARRFAARADALLAYEPPKVRDGMRARLKKAVGIMPAGTLVVSPPAASDVEWERDGVNVKAPKGTGERAHWLTELLAQVRPEHWEERFDAAAPELIRAALATEWGHAVLHGWSRAAIAHSSGAWATALWDAWRAMTLDDAAPKHESATRRQMVSALLAHLPVAEAEARVLALMGSAARELPFELGTLVDSVPAPWSAGFARSVLERIAPWLELTATFTTWGPGSWFELLAPIAIALPPECFADALSLERRIGAIENIAPVHQRRLEELAQVVRLRHRIHEEIPVEPDRR